MGKMTIWSNKTLKSLEVVSVAPNLLWSNAFDFLYTFIHKVKEDNTTYTCIYHTNVHILFYTLDIPINIRYILIV